MSDSFENSPEYDNWIESGGRDEDYEYYYNKWQRRTRWPLNPDKPVWDLCKIPQNPLNSHQDI